MHKSVTVGRLRALVFALLVAFAVTGCASTQKDADAAAAANGEVYDPFEPVNRVFFDFNMFLDRNILRPVARFYVDFVPEFVRAMVHNALEVLDTPVVLGNELLQGDVDRFMHSFGRLTVNLAAGMGVLDVAGDAAPPLEEDFGQTLAVWGAPGGPYLVLPFLGPSNVRDAIGKGVDSYGDPVSFMINDVADANDREKYSFMGSRFVAGVVDKRSRILGQLEELEKTSLDFYATIRSLYDQKRRDEIRNGESTEPIPIPEISFERNDRKPPPKVTAPVPTKASLPQ
ncbi:MAG: VacJ family lipoprotein [Alphaproteobacteria bacterium]|nr:VacJ family lipoprotein [Alphaproteobacteria bacterium]